MPRPKGKARKEEKSRKTAASSSSDVAKGPTLEQALFHSDGESSQNNVQATAEALSLAEIVESKLKKLKQSGEIDSRIGVQSIVVGKDNLAALGALASVSRAQKTLEKVFASTDDQDVRGTAVNSALRTMESLKSECSDLNLPPMFDNLFSVYSNQLTELKGITSSPAAQQTEPADTSSIFEAETEVGGESDLDLLARIDRAIAQNTSLLNDVQSILKSHSS